MAASAAEVYFAEVAEGRPDRRPGWRRLADFLVSMLAERSIGGGGHVVAIRLVADPSVCWVELGPATRREAAGLCKGIRQDLSKLSQSEFERKYRAHHEPLPPWPTTPIDPWSG
ncbi:MAG TPA: hypothetical protein VNA14_05655 [Mycobacteriales bacterium]|nr:hypothetical protein [Mycobacteriales bacterium]